MRKIAGAFTIFLALSLTPEFAVSAEPTVTVMSRNLYLGADVGVALQLIPDLPAAAQFMWGQVAATDFEKRSEVLVEEILQEKPDVIGIQEATRWFCKKTVFSKKKTVFDFTQTLIDKLGGNYVLATKDGVTAFNPGYSIPAIPFLTTVEDRNIFAPLFGTAKVACGFEIADALLIKKSLQGSLLRVGNTEYESSYKIIPTIMTIHRGYTWADISIGGKPVRFISTHLESLWDPGKVPTAAKQAAQLVSDVANTQTPIVIMGDFNSDPRDPRSADEANPGEQPESDLKVCPVGKSTCSAFKIMKENGFIDAGPDSSDPLNYTWGMNALLTGPDSKRVARANMMGNKFGFTDRLDYIFLKNGPAAVSSKIFGTKPPYGSDHAGLVSTISISSSTLEASPELPKHSPFPISFWQIVTLVLVVLISWLTVKWIKRR